MPTDRLAAVSRGRLLAGVGLATAAVAASTACVRSPASPRTGSGSPTPVPAPAVPIVPAGPAVAVAAHAPAAHAPAPAVASAAPATGATAGLLKANEMDKHHEAGIKAFPAKTGVLGNTRLQPTMDGDVKVFKVTAGRTKWEVEPGKFVDAFAYNSQVPGPAYATTWGYAIVLP
jgi:hypothetical protein